jgi:fructan beta-fructosidase
MTYREPFRPQFHFTPTANWLNDPNGLVYYDGEYHLFYQYNPAGIVHGPMHWGHAVSTDLLNWSHFPVALCPDEYGAIYSGSAVIDWHNTAGLGKEAMVAIFTHHSDDRQSQSIAHSTDKGRSWIKYDGNPVVEPPDGVRDFRDPKVFWLEEGSQAGHWVMALAAGNSILFYSSPDLKNWSQSGAFGPGFGSVEGVWETPDLFELPVDGGPATRWVLTVGVGDGSPAGGSGVQYFVGDFDGANFTSDNHKGAVLWADYGADFYAAQSWNDAPDGRRIWLAWMSNWRYAQSIPTTPWRGAFTLPREVDLRTTRHGNCRGKCRTIRLGQRPIVELQRLRGRRWSWRNETISPGVADLLDEVTGETLEIVADFDVEDTRNVAQFGFQLRTSDNETTTVGYLTHDRLLFVDRTASGQVEFNPAFPRRHTAALEPAGASIRLHLFVDRSSVEVFGDDGQVALTERIFPNRASTGIELFADGEGVRLVSLDIYRLRPAAFSDTTVDQDFD